MSASTYPANNIQVVQAIAGCVQLRSAQNHTLWLDALAQSLQGQTGVYSAHKDPSNGNLIVLFDPNLLPLPQMLAILQQWGVSGVAFPQNPAMQVGGFLHEHHEVKSILPMIAGMLVTQTLKLRGGWAMLANVMAASFTSQALEQLENASTTLSPATTEIDVTAQPIIAPQSIQTPTPETSSNSFVSIIHAIPGRVRLRVLPLLEDAEYAKRLQKLLSQNPLFTRVSINTKAASIVVEYDETERISDAKIRQHIVELINSIIAEELPPENQSETPPLQSSFENNARELPKVENNEGELPKKVKTEVERADSNSDWACFHPKFACVLLTSIVRRVAVKTQK